LIVFAKAKNVLSMRVYDFLKHLCIGAESINLVLQRTQSIRDDGFEWDHKEILGNRFN